MSGIHNTTLTKLFDIGGDDIHTHIRIHDDGLSNKHCAAVAANCTG